MQFTPMRNRALVKPIKEEDVTESGIVLAGVQKDKPNRGTIVALGTMDPGQAEDVKVGDRIMYSRWAGSDLEIDDEHHVVLDLKDILLVEVP
jgi:chaperonin GroES